MCYIQSVRKRDKGKKEIKYLAIRRLPENMTKEQAQKIADKIEHDNKVDVQVKSVPDLGGVAFVMKSDVFSGEHMRTIVNHLIETNWGVK